MYNIEELVEKYGEEISVCKTSAELQETKSRLMGKNSKFTAILHGLKDVPAEKRRETGILLNTAREKIENMFANKQKEITAAELTAKLSREKVDITLVKSMGKLGNLHPITKTTNEIMDLFIGLGFDILEGPEIENDYYNFEALNVPADHPARDMQDTFYITKNLLLRTHTSPNQVRTMEVRKPPIKILCPGKVYRSDSDTSHSPIFHQIEGLVVDEHITMCDLLGTLEYVFKNLFSPETKVRFRPSYFPFTEPSVEVDVSCTSCGGKGCSVCKHTGWVEILGAGIVHPYVLENCGIDSNKYSAFAVGFGIERMAMIKYGITDIKLFYEDDIRFLKQFNV